MSRLFKLLHYLLSAVLILSLGTELTQAQPKTYHEVKVFVDADQSFVQRAGGEVKALQAIHELIAQVDAIYRVNLGLTVTLVGPHLWTESDPFDRSSQSSLLASFASYAESTYRQSANYDMAQLLVGTGMGGEGGIAYPGGACGNGTAAHFAYAVSQPDLTDQYQFSPHLFSHELGHTLNSDHDTFPDCRVKTIMCPGQIGGEFSAQSKSMITDYVASRVAAGCFPETARVDPAAAIKLAVTYAKSTVKYAISGGQSCTSLSLVGSPTVKGLGVIFAYLQIGTLTPASMALAQSKNAVALRGSSKLYLGVYCDGQLAKSVVRLQGTKIKSPLATTSAVIALRSLQKKFKKA